MDKAIGAPQRDGSGGGAPGRAAPMARPNSSAAGAVAALMGFSLGWLLVSLTARLATVFHDVPYRDTIVPAACLAALAVGIRLPRRIAVGLASLAWKRHDGASDRAPEGTAPLPVGPEHALAPPPRDPALLWAVMAAAAMTAGLSVVVLGALARGVERTHEYAIRHFFWMPPTDIMLAAALSMGWVLVTMALTGVVLACLNRFRDVDRGHATDQTPFLLAGATAGLLAVQPFTRRGVQPDLPVVLAAVPILLAAMLAVQQTKRLAATSVPRDEFPTNNVTSNTALLRCITIICTAALVGSLSLWSRCIPEWTGSAMRGSMVLAWLLGASAVGALIASRRPLTDANAAIKLAHRAGLAGLVTITVAIGIGTLNDPSPPRALAISMLAAGLSVTLVAAALTSAFDCAKSHTSLPGGTSAPLLADGLLASAVSLCAVAPVAPTGVRSHMIIVAVGLTLAAVAASLVLHDATRALGSRVARASILLTAAVGVTAFLPGILPRTTPRTLEAPAEHDRSIAVAESADGDGPPG